MVLEISPRRLTRISFSVDFAVDFAFDFSGEMPFGLVCRGVPVVKCEGRNACCEMTRVSFSVDFAVDFAFDFSGKMPFGLVCGVMPVVIFPAKCLVWILTYRTLPPPRARYTHFSTLSTLLYIYYIFIYINIYIYIYILFVYF